MMVVGEAGSGKSTNVAILAKALSRLHANGVEDRDGFYKQVDRLLLNPKSITAGKATGTECHGSPELGQYTPCNPHIMSYGHEEIE